MKVAFKVEIFLAIWLELKIFFKVKIYLGLNIKIYLGDPRFNFLKEIWFRVKIFWTQKLKVRFFLIFLSEGWMISGQEQFSVEFKFTS
jgi:hypothetical protein